MKKRFLSIALAVTMVFIMAVEPAAAAGVSSSGPKTTAVTLRVEGYGAGAIAPVAVTLPETHKTLAEYGLTGLGDEPKDKDGKPVYTPLHVLAQYCVDQRKDPKTEIQAVNGSYGVYLEDFMKLKDANAWGWAYCVNNAPVLDEHGMEYGIGACPVVTGNTVTLYASFYSAANGSTSYGFFESGSKDAVKDQGVTLTLNALQYDAAENKMLPKPVSGASLSVKKADGSEAAGDWSANTTETGSDGKIVLTFQKEGQYLVRAQKGADLAGAPGGKFQAISGTECLVTVKTAPPPGGGGGNPGGSSGSSGSSESSSQSVASSQSSSSGTGEPTPGQKPGELSAQWPQHLGAADNNALTAAATPLEAQLQWASQGKVNESWGGGYAGSPLLIDGKVYIARDGQLQVLNASNGTVEKAADTAAPLGYYSYPTYGAGMLFVPLGNGQVQVFNAKTLESLYLTETVTDGNGEAVYQGLSPVYYADGMFYVGLTNGGSKGLFAAYSAEDPDGSRGDETKSYAWTYGAGGYYGAGAVKAGDNIVFGGDDGVLVSINAKTGVDAKTVSLSGQIRGSVVSAEGYFWVATKNSMLYKVLVAQNGTPSVVGSVQLPGASASTPVVAGGKVFAVGAKNKGGFLNVYNAADLSLLASQDLAAEGKGLLVSTGAKEGELCAYLTQNNTPGGVTLARLNAANALTLTDLFVPEQGQQNYCISILAADSNGVIYYGNDSGNLFALKGKGENPPSSVPSSTPSQTPSGDPNPSSQAPASSKTPVSSNTPASQPVPPASSQSGGNNGGTTSSQPDQPGSNLKDPIAQEIWKAAEDGQNLVNVTKTDGELSAEVFSELKKHPEMRLAVDAGGYAMSFLGKDVLTTNKALRMGLTALSDKETKAKLPQNLGKHQIIKFAHTGVFPAKATVVYRLPETLQNEKTIYVYTLSDGKAPQFLQEATVDNKCAMFTAQYGGEYLLSATRLDTESPEAEPTSSATVSGAGSDDGDFQFPGWAYFTITVGAVTIAGVGVYLVRRRKA